MHATHNPMRRLLSRGAAVARFVFVPLAASAAWITVPTGWSPGDQYHQAIVTTTTRDAYSSNIADYKRFRDHGGELRHRACSIGDDLGCNG